MTPPLWRAGTLADDTAASGWIGCGASQDARRIIDAISAIDPNPERGVYRSRDGGAHWQRVLGQGEDTGAIDLAFEPGHPQVAYAAMWQVRRTPWNVYPPASEPGSGLYKSSDGGDSWVQVRGNGFPEHVGRIGIAIAQTEPSRVYAIVDGDAGGLYRSDDAGAHWRRTSEDPRIWQRGWYFGRITVDPHDADRIYALNTIVLRADDGGANFDPLKGDATGDDFHELWIDPANSDRQILGVDQGAIVTLNGGRTWSSWHNQPTAENPPFGARIDYVRATAPRAPVQLAILDAAGQPVRRYALRGYDALMPMLERSLADWQQLLATDLATVNAQLRAAGQPELTVAAPATAQ